MLASLRIRILLAALLVIVLALVANGIINYVTLKHHNDEQVSSNLKAVVNGNTQALNEWFNARYAMLDSMEEAVTTSSPKSALRQLEVSGDFMSTYLATPEDSSLVTSDDWVPPGDYDPRERPWYQAAVRERDTIITAPYVDAQTGNLVVTFARPYYSGSRLEAVIGADIMIGDIIDIVANIAPTPSSFGFLTTDDGSLVAHPDTALTLEPATTINPILNAAQLDSIATNDTPTHITLQDGDKRLLGRTLNGTSGWQLTVALDEHEATAGLRATTMASLITLLTVGVITAIALGIMLKLLLRRLLSARDAMHNIASGEGDLTQRLPEQGHDEIAQIAAAFNRFVSRMDDVLIDVRQSSHAVSTAATEIATGGQDLSRRTENAASSLQQTSASMEEITSTVEHTAASAREANQLSDSAAQVAERGGQAVAEVVTTMEEIATSSHQIGDIVALMDGIAFQTNLLALNASVEAARAGEHGRGFAVVADEVRKLASRSTDAANDIKTLIETSQSRVENGTQLVQRAGDTMQDIVRNIAQVSDVLGEISSATGEQSDGISQVNVAVAELDRMTQENAAMVEESTTAAEQLREQAQHLSEVISHFKLSIATQSGQARLP
ncbi:MAG: methyl-accepting chemotaxis protein [Pseudomonadota bacterium]